MYAVILLARLTSDLFYKGRNQTSWFLVAYCYTLWLAGLFKNILKSTLQMDKYLLWASVTLTISFFVICVDGTTYAQLNTSGLIDLNHLT